LLLKGVDFLLVFHGEFQKRVMRFFRAQEFLDHLINDAHPGLLLYPAELIVVVLESLTLFLLLVAGNPLSKVLHLTRSFQLLLPALIKVVLLFQHTFPLLQTLVHLYTLLDELLLLLHFLVPYVPLFHDALFEAVQFSLGHLLGVVLVVR